MKTILTYSAQFIKLVYREDNWVFSLELLEDSPSHPEMKKGSLDVICLNDLEDYGMMQDFFGPYCIEENDPLFMGDRTHDYHLLVGKTFEFRFVWSGQEYPNPGKWSLDKVSYIANPMSNKLTTITGNIVDINVTTYTVEVLFKIDGHETQSSYKSFFFNIREDAFYSLYKRTFHPYINYFKEGSDAFSKEKLLVVEQTPQVLSIGSRTTLDTHSLALLKVFPVNEVLNNDYTE